MLTTVQQQTQSQANLSAVRSQIALNLVGNNVDLLTASKTILHGTVTGVFTEAGMPKIVVNGRRYDMNQILTVQPPALN
jgi:hypothetical protein